MADLGFSLTYLSQKPFWREEPGRRSKQLEKDIDIMSEKWKVHFFHLQNWWSSQTCHVSTRPNRWCSFFHFYSIICDKKELYWWLCQCLKSPIQKQDGPFDGRNSPPSPPRPLRHRSDRSILQHQTLWLASTRSNSNSGTKGVFWGLL